MKFLCLIFSLCLVYPSSFAQSQDDIVKEGFLLYYTEMASWTGTDMLLESFPEKRDQVGGYFSYSQDHVHTCLFFDKGSPARVLVSFAFDDRFSHQSAKTDTVGRLFTSYEQDLYTIRQLALEELNRDTLFKSYNNSNLNLIPVIQENQKKVFVLTGPSVGGVIIFGNDYLLTFGSNNKLKTKKALHKNILTLPYNEETQGATGFHNHQPSTGDLITSTDICTLLLYEKAAGLKQYIVMSEKKVSIWSCEADNLLVLDRKAWDKIGNHGKD
ncbi:MAG: hypothetical protein NWR72_07280 [Bacteroidia bacterium]|nr:hypothetical protein [Bacteroidia bacterium]